MDLTTVVETRPGVRNGKARFVGTRIAVYDVLVGRIGDDGRGDRRRLPGADG